MGHLGGTGSAGDVTGVEPGAARAGRRLPVRRDAGPTVGPLLSGVLSCCAPRYAVYPTEVTAHRPSPDRHQQVPPAGEGCSAAALRVFCTHWRWSNARNACTAPAMANSPHDE